jgi:hypothetical protein
MSLGNPDEQVPEFICPVCIREGAEDEGTFTLEVGKDSISIGEHGGELVWETALRDGRVLHGRVVDGTVVVDRIGPYDIPDDAELVCDNDGTHRFGVEVRGAAVYRFWPTEETVQRPVVAIGAHVHAYRVDRSCGVDVCDECREHKGLARCFCGWSRGGGDGYAELVELGERIEEE